MIIKTIDDAIDVLEDFIDELDERYGIGMFTYGEDAYDAIRLMRELRIEEFKGKINRILRS